MTEWIDILKLLKDPNMIILGSFSNFKILGAVIIGLFYLLLRQEKTITALRVVIDTNMAESNLTIKQLVTLVEVLVYGRNRNGNA
jgi:hypothetical protein